MSDKQYLQAASVRDLILSHGSKYVLLHKDGSRAEWTDSEDLPDGARIFYRKSTRAELLARFAALEAERDELRSLLERAHTYLEQTHQTQKSRTTLKSI